MTSNRRSCRDPLRLRGAFLHKPLRQLQQIVTSAELHRAIIYGSATSVGQAPFRDGADHSTRFFDSFLSAARYIPAAARRVILSACDKMRLLSAVTALLLFGTLLP